MLPDRVSKPGPLTYESGALQIALGDPASFKGNGYLFVPVSFPGDGKIPKMNFNLRRRNLLLREQILCV